MLESAAVVPKTSMMCLKVFVFILLAFLCDLCKSEETLDKLFENGVDSFTNEKWDECFVHFENVLSNLKKSKVLTADCHRRCDEEATLASITPENSENLHNLEKFVKRTLCFLDCGSVFPNVQSVNKWRVYEYLQHCYFQTNQLNKAASAAYTVLTNNPKHEAMTSMLKFYAIQPGFSPKNINNMEGHPYTSHYRKGVIAYESKDFVQVIKMMEQTLEVFLAEEESCRAACVIEVPEILEWLPEHSSPVIRHIANDLQCKRKCGTPKKNFPSNIFKYLHFAYFKVGDYKRACEAFASFQHFRPSDNKLSSIMTHYRALAQVAAEDCVPRQATAKHVARKNYEEKLYKEIQIKIGSKKIDENLIESSTSNENEGSHSTDLKSVPGEDDFNAVDEAAEVDAILKSFMKDTKLLKSGAELNGATRFLAEGLASEEECQMLVQLAKAVVPLGHEFINNNPTPFSRREEFMMLDMDRAALMGHFGIVDQAMVDTMLEVTERGKLFLEKQFNLEGKLFQEGCNLNCKTPTDEQRTEMATLLPLSHPFHADNCLKQEDGVTCIKNAKDEWRDFSSIIYLNDDFEGGELLFSSNFSIDGVQAEVAPHCGHQVGFSSGTENIHGVRGVSAGSRCSLVNFFTLTPEKNSPRRILVQMFRDRARLMGTVSEDAIRKLDHHREFS